MIKINFRIIKINLTKDSNSNHSVTTFLKSRYPAMMFLNVLFDFIFKNFTRQYRFQNFFEQKQKPKMFNWN
jgi:hypothetical protein